MSGAGKQPEAPPAGGFTGHGAWWVGFGLESSHVLGTSDKLQNQQILLTGVLIALHLLSK